MNKRDLVFVPVGNDAKPHPGIVLDIWDDDLVVVVIAGTGTERSHFPFIKVAAESKEAKALRLYKDTYFYLSNVVAVPKASKFLAVVRGKCPPELFRRLTEFAAPAIASVKGSP